jgi:hypothetical protein
VRGGVALLLLYALNAHGVNKATWTFIFLTLVLVRFMRLRGPHGSNEKTLGVFALGNMRIKRCGALVEVLLCLVGLLGMADFGSCECNDSNASSCRQLGVLLAHLGCCYLNY